jgi:NAD(P)-dependent dehydrogenase (short-subunit alcohol dehydrogenase family)
MGAIKEEVVMNRLKGKRALITGGTSGIGLETARQFLSEGARIAITGKNPAALEAARKELGSEVLAIASDEPAFTVGSELMIDGGMGNL